MADLRVFFGRCTLIKAGFLVPATVAVVLAREAMAGAHTRLFRGSAG